MRVCFPGLQAASFDLTAAFTNGTNKYVQVQLSSDQLYYVTARLPGFSNSPQLP
jgi:hypothetical protein